MEKQVLDLDLHKGDRSFADQVCASPGGDTLSLCFQCGICTGTCPVSSVDQEFSPARIVQWVRLGLKETVLQSRLIWLCMQCHRCSFHCPQGVRFADIDRVLRQMAVEEGHLDPATAQRIEQSERDLRRLRILVLEHCMAQAPSDSCEFQDMVQRSLGEMNG